MHLRKENCAFTKAASIPARPQSSNAGPRLFGLIYRRCPPISNIFSNFSSSALKRHPRNSIVIFDATVLALHVQNLVFRGHCGRGAAAATCGHGRCEHPAILRVTQKSLAASNFFCGRRRKAKNLAIPAAEMAATVLTAILRCDFCAAKVQSCEDMIQPLQHQK